MAGLISCKEDITTEFKLFRGLQITVADKYFRHSTCNVSKLYPSETYVDLNGEQRKAMADQIATVSKGRLGSRLGELSQPDILAVERVIRVQLGMKPDQTR